MNFILNLLVKGRPTNEANNSQKQHKSNFIQISLFDSFDFTSCTLP